MFLSPSGPTRRRQRKFPRGRTRLELLESRTLLSAVISTYALPSGFQAFGGTYDDAGNLWVIDATSLNKVVNNTVTSYALPAVDADAAPVGVVAGHNGHIYVTDFFGGIDDFNTATQTFATPYTWAVGDNFDFSPTFATVTGDSAVWFVTHNTSTITTNINDELVTDDRTSYIGRLDPTTHAVTFTTINDFDPTVSDSQAISISANGNDGVYIGMGVLDDVAAGNTLLFGTNRIVTASFHTGTNNVQVDHVFTLNTGDAAADAYSYLTGVATAPDGSVWFSLANSNQPSLRPATPADRLVHGVINPTTHLLDQTAFIVPGATDTTPLAINNLTADASGRIWFNEILGTQMDYYDTATSAFATPLTYPSSLQLENGGSVGQIFASPSGNEVSMIVFDGTPEDGSPLVKVNVANDAPTFANFTATLAGNHAEDVAQTLNVSFTASAPVSGTYHVSINWGDGSPIDNVNATLVSGQYVASKNHIFTSQGTYPVSITVSDNNSQPTHNLVIHPVITDTPLAVTSFAANNLAARVVLTTLTFTDDVDSTASQFTVTINWGDNTTSRGLVVRDPSTPGRYIVIALHQYKKKGTYSVTGGVTTTEVNASITSNTATASVTV